MLVAPVGPARFRWYPDAGTAGRAAAFSFKHQDRIYTLFYAHCEEPLWESGTEINMGDLAARSGCSGNSESCGVALDEGGRTDHVHVGLKPGTELKKSSPYFDPAIALTWNIRPPNS